jgi:hypothetical protein
MKLGETIPTLKQHYPVWTYYTDLVLLTYP